MKRKRLEESSLFNDFNNNIDNSDGVSIITPSSNPFNLISPKSLLPTFLKQELNSANVDGTPSCPFPTLDTPPTQGANGNLISPFLPSGFLDTPTELRTMSGQNPTNEQQLFGVVNSAPPFEGNMLQTPVIDIPTPLLTSEGPFPPQSSEQNNHKSYNGHQPPPPPISKKALPPLPMQPLVRETKHLRRSMTPDTPNDDDSQEDEDEGINLETVVASTAKNPTCAFFRIVEGLNKTSNVKYLGGKQNSQYPMPAQVLELDWNKIPHMLMEQHSLSNIHQLACRAFVLGFDRQRRSMASLGRVSSDKRFHESPDGRWVAVFNDIFIQYASHNYGQRLALRFHLVIINDVNNSSDDERVICQVDSTEFQTITKRGLEKEQQRERNRIEKHKYGAVVERTEPAIGFPVGNQLVKIYLSGMVGDSTTANSAGNNSQFLSQSQVSVFFGDLPSPEIHSVKKNVIICETPEHPPGIVDVVVSLVKKDNVGTCLSSKAKFHFVDPDDREAPMLVLKHFSQKVTYSDK